MVVYNPLAWEVMVPIRFPVSVNNLTVMRDNGTMMTVQIQKVTEGTQHARGKLGSAQYTLTFVVS